MNNNKGFTLIELVIVIVILGILAATAAPKFIDLTGDARESVVKGVEGSMNSAADIVHAKALIEGEIGTTGSVSAGTSSITLANGWPTADEDGIGAAIELSTESGIVSGTLAGPGLTTGYSLIHEDAVTTNTCGVNYKAAVSSEDRPAIVSSVEGC